MQINITWHSGTLTIYDCDSQITIGSVPHDEPITAITDSHDIANKVADHFGWTLAGNVEHDKGDIFCTVEPGVVA